MSEIDKIITNDLKPVLHSLNEKDAKIILELKEELIDNWKKKQIFRTEVEMRVAVLNDVQNPTDASKYWQAVTEMSTMFDALMVLSFDLRENEIKRLKLEQKMEKAQKENDNLKIKKIQIQLDRNEYECINMKQIASDRIRELNLWSKIKKELNNGEFNIRNVNEHQSESYRLYWDNRVKALNSTSSPGDIMNALGPKISIEKLSNKENGKLLKFDEVRKLIN
jgi:hypothetical protein